MYSCGGKLRCYKPKFTNKYMLINNRLCAHLINIQSVCMPKSLIENFSVNCLSVASFSTNHLEPFPTVEYSYNIYFPHCIVV